MSEPLRDLAVTGTAHPLSNTMHLLGGSKSIIDEKEEDSNRAEEPSKRGVLS